MPPRELVCNGKSVGVANAWRFEAGAYEAVVWSGEPYERKSYRMAPGETCRVVEAKR